MLDFCAEHGIASEIEVIAPDYINEAYDRVVASDVRYRFVIDTESLRGGVGCAEAGELLSSAASKDSSGHPAAASLAATRAMFSGPPSWWATPSMNCSISSRSTTPSFNTSASCSGDLADHFFDVVVAQRGVSQQGQQRHPIRPRHAAGIAGTQPVDDGAEKRLLGHSLSVSRIRASR